MKVFFPVPVDVGNPSNHVKFVCVFFIFFKKKFHYESLQEDQHFHNRFILILYLRFYLSQFLKVKSYLFKLKRV